MKKVICLLIAFATANALFAQYCGNSGPAICTPSGTVGQGMFTPSPQQLPPLISGQYSSTAIQLQMPDSIPAFGINNAYYTITIDSISNLPSGVCWATNKADNTFLPNEHGCLVLSGTPCGVNGQYKPKIHVTFTSPSFYLLISGHDLDGFGYKYFLRVKNAADPTTPIDTTQTSTNPILPYTSTPTCNTSPYFFASIASSDSVCDGGTVRVNVLTNMTFSNANHFKLKIGCGSQTHFCMGTFYSDSVRSASGGTFSFSLPDSIVTYLFNCINHDVFDLTVQSTDTTIQAFAGTLTIFTAAKVLYAYNASVCLGTPMLAGGYLCSSQTTALYEMPSHTIISGSTITTLTPTHTTTYLMEVTRGICITDSSFTITVNTLPVPQVADTLFNTCANDSVTLRAVHTTYGYYYWIYDNSFLSDSANITVLPSSSAVYSLYLQDSNFCYASKSVVVNIKQAPYQPICMVTVDSASSHNVVVWEKADKAATDSFYIYREISTNNYQRIAAVPRDFLSQYDDYGANPNATGYRYKISVLDTCGNEGQTSLYHNSIHLQYLGAGNLQWNDYDIESSTTPVLSYDLLRDSLGTGIWNPILNVSGTQNTATDPDFLSYPNAKYKVIANWSYGCTPSRSGYLTSSSNSVRNQVTGVSDETMNAFHVAPNPTKGAIFVTLSQEGDISIKDMAGKELIAVHATGSSQVVDISSFSDGLYILTFQNSALSISKKILKIK